MNNPLTKCSKSASHNLTPRPVVAQWNKIKKTVRPDPDPSLSLRL